MIRSLIGALALVFAWNLSPPAPQAGQFNIAMVQHDPVDIGEAGDGVMLWNGGNYGEPLRTAPLSWTDTGRKLPLFIAEYGEGRGDHRWLCIRFDEAREHASVRAWVDTDFGQFPVVTLHGTELSIDEHELRFRIVARYSAASKPEVWRGKLALPQD